MYRSGFFHLFFSGGVSGKDNLRPAIAELIGTFSLVSIGAGLAALI
jgi:hypothetical protein